MLSLHLVKGGPSLLKKLPFLGQRRLFLRTFRLRGHQVVALSLQTTISRRKFRLVAVELVTRSGSDFLQLLFLSQQPFSVLEHFDERARCPFGFYPRSGFMHLDLGPARQWGERFPVRDSAFAAELPPAREALAESRTMRGGGAAGVAPPVVEYSREFQARAAEELALLRHGSAIIEMMGDYAVLRAQMRSCEAC